MNEKDEKSLGYQFTAMPTNLMACMDLNCRSMLFTLVQLSSYYAKDDGWFFRTNEDLRAESQLSENLVRATLSALYKIGVVDVKTVGKGKSKTPNQFRLDAQKFKEWDKYDLEDCIKHPDLRIETDNYKAKGWQPSYIKQLDNAVSFSTDVQMSSPILSQSEDYIENIDNKENKTLPEANLQVEVKTDQFEEYKKREDYLMDKLYHVSTWIDFKTYRKQIEELISMAQTERVAEKTRTRYKKIEEGKIKFLKTKISNEPYNSYYEDFYKEYDCGWLGKEGAKVKQNIVQPKSSNNIDNEDDNKEIMRNFCERFGMEIPDEYKPKNVARDIYNIKVPNLNDDGDDLPF